MFAGPSESREDEAVSMVSGGARHAGLCALLTLIAACGPAATPSSPGPPGAQSYREYAAAACIALQALWNGYGNPDTAGLSPLMRAFEDAVKQGDAVAAGSRADAVLAELERGRASAAIAAGWPDGTQSMVQMDRLLLATEAMVRTRQAATSLGYLEATNRGQAAFEAAGGIDAWYGMLNGIGAATKAAHQPWPRCEGIPMS